MAILVYNGPIDSAPWISALQQYLPEEEVHVYPNIPDKAAIEFAAVWDHPAGILADYPNLKAILILGAGGDFLLKDKNLPDVPIVRLVDDTVVKDMAQYCVYWVTHFYRHFDLYRENQSRNHWQRLEYPPIEQFKVGVLGLGAIGSAVSQSLLAQGYAVSAFVSYARQLDGVEIYAGDDQFAQFMGTLDVLINVLPLTPATHHFLNEERLSLLPRGAKVINISRGAVIDEAALLALLNSGHIGGAALDVFSEEPLPDHSPLWQHPTVNITPHASGQTYVRSAIKSVVENIKKMKAGEQPGPLFDLTRGY